MTITRKPARKATKRTAAKKVAGRTIRRRSTVSGRATLKAQQTRRAARRGTRTATLGRAVTDMHKMYKRYRHKGYSHEKARAQVIEHYSDSLKTWNRLP